MPLGEVAQVLKHAWGEGWEKRFDRFNFTPLAAASIGQVHEAILKDGRRLAVKIQYPGIRASIDSDVDNVATLLRFARLVPEEIDFAPLLQEAKSQLHAEADYRREALALGRFADRLASDSRFEVPEVVDTLTTGQTLAMQFLDGDPIESLADAPALERNDGAAALLELAVREVFDWGLVQTDPNFANYLYASRSHRIQLLDFGATRDYAPESRSELQELLAACVEGSDADVAACATAVGYLDPVDPARYRESVVALLRAATEPARSAGDYPFGRTDLAGRMKDLVLDMRLNQRFARIPPPPVLFLHRKLGGLYLLLSRLRASIPVKALLEPWVTGAVQPQDPPLIAGRAV
jgi:predicted unusual protein kinase regulating ubiquinone biosynthesis (AarF/ABC1/UbiB family)